MLKLHDNIDEVQDKMFYRIDETLYFIYTREYEGIGQVKVFFDTTEYISTQMTILKISFVVILVALFLNFFIGKIISRRLLRDLKNISDKLQGIDMDGRLEKIDANGPEGDEIKILTDTLNKSFLKIEKQTQNLKQFITDVSHEFKTPLMSLNSKIDVLERKLQGHSFSKKEQEEFFVYIKSNTSKLNSLLETLFLLSRYEEKIQKFSPRNINFSEYLEKKARDFFHLRDSVSVEYDIQPDVFFDIEDTTCNIIIENLLTNAVKFADVQEPKVVVGCDRNTFWISDNGIGIKSEEVEKIYDKFHK